jgi:hypothetical protein
MFKGLFSKRPTTKGDIVLAIGAAVLAAWKAVDTIKDYKEEQSDDEKEIEQ